MMMGGIRDPIKTLSALTMVVILIFAPRYADAAVISATLDRQGLVTEIAFGFDGPAPRMRLSPHGNELWIDLDRTALQIPSRPLYGREAAPIGMVRAFSPGGLHARIVVEVTSRADYAIVQHPREILLRLAPAGA